MLDWGNPVREEELLWVPSEGFFSGLRLRERTGPDIQEEDQIGTRERLPTFSRLYLTSKNIWTTEDQGAAVMSPPRDTKTETQSGVAGPQGSR